MTTVQPSGTPATSYPANRGQKAPPTPFKKPATDGLVSQQEETFQDIYSQFSEMVKGPKVSTDYPRKTSKTDNMRELGTG